MTSQEAEGYHSKQISIFAEQTEADLVTAFTINYVEEAIGIVKVWKKNKQWLHCREWQNKGETLSNVYN